MRLHRRLGQAQRGGYLRVGQTTADLREHLSFAGGEPAEPVVVGVA